MVASAVFFIVAAAVTYIAAASTATVVSRQVIWKSYETNPGLPAYDIFVSPVLLLAGNSSILSFVAGRKCDPGPQGCQDDVGRHDILVKRSDDGGKTFGNAVLVHSETVGNHTVVIGNPSAVLDEATGRIVLLFCRNNTFVLRTVSDDMGATWTSPNDITSAVKEQSWGWYATTFSSIQLKHQPDRQRNGRLVMCCDHQTNYTFKDDGHGTFSYSHLIYSDDGGAEWKIGAQSRSRTTNECAVAELSNGTLVVNARNYVGQESPSAPTHRAISWSHDGGESLSDAYFPTSLPDPICEGAMATDATGEVLVFTHPKPSPACRGQCARDHMTLFTSADAGINWQAAVLLEPSTVMYSSVILLPNGSFAVQYDVGQTHFHRCVNKSCHEQFDIINLD
jgi:sialidase-1